MRILEEHHQQERGVAGRGERGGMIPGGHRRLPQPDAKHDERCHSHDDGRDHDPLEHHPIENRLFRRSGWAVEFVALPGLEGEGDVLDAVGHEVQPEELRRCERQR